jgi:hypothetical protein
MSDELSETETAKVERTALQMACRSMMRTLEKLPAQEQRRALVIVGAYFGLEVTP